jgi:hypothetical protein
MSMAAVLGSWVVGRALPDGFLRHGFKQLRV